MSPNLVYGAESTPQRKVTRKLVKQKDGAPKTNMMVLPVQAVQFSRNYSEMEQSLRKKSLKEESLNQRIEKALTEQRASPLKKASTAKLNRPATKSEAQLEVTSHN